MTSEPQPRDDSSTLDRRDVLALGAASLAGLAAGAQVTPVAAQEADKPKPKLPAKVITHGRIQQSIVHWCYGATWDVPGMIEVAHAFGIPSVELIDPKYWPLLKERNMVCAIAGSHGFAKGFGNRDQWEECTKVLHNRIDECKSAGVPSVITFTGMKVDGQSADEGKKNCIEGLKQVVGHAEKQGITLCLEMLNTRDASHPMKGHPGYLGDHTDFCIDIIKAVGSPRLKLLFDIYHVQIMDGDVIRRIREQREYLGHIHTAGNPGRGELDNTQEINYPAVMQALLDVGYKGYVGQEFIPTRDPLVGLTEAIRLCDV